jgi:BASS family bile acid:Na+ symporter
VDPKELVPILAQGALFLIVASFGLRAHAREVLAAIRHSGLLLKGIVAVNIVVPATAIFITSLLPIDPIVRIGIVLMAVSPLAPLVPGKLMKGGLDASTAVGLYVALILAAILFVPATVTLLSALYPGDATISIGAIAKLVAVTILLPLALGVAVASWAPARANSLAKVLFLVGLAAIAILVVLILVKQGGAIAGLVGDGTVLAIVATVATGLLAGHLLGGPQIANSNALAVAAAIRHPGIAALIAHENFTDHHVMLAVILFLLTSVVLVTLYQFWLKRRLQPEPVGQQPT